MGEKENENARKKKMTENKQTRRMLHISITNNRQIQNKQDNNCINRMKFKKKTKQNEKT